MGKENKVNIEKVTDGSNVTVGDNNSIHITHHSESSKGSKKSLLHLGYVSLLLAMGILLLLVFADSLKLSSLLQDRVYYICLLLMGIFSAIALFGFLKSTTEITGHLGGIAIQIAGPAALACIVIVSGFYLIPKYEFFDVTIRAVNENGHPVYSDRKALVKLLLPTGVRQAQFTSNGEATIKGLPYSLFNSKQQIIVDIYYYDHITQNKKYALTKDVVVIKLVENPSGTTQGILNRKKAHLEVLKLLMPYKLMLAENGALEYNIDQYFEEKSLQIFQQFDVQKKIHLSPKQKYAYFDVLYEHAPEYLNLNGKTYAELIHETAINFRRNVSIMSQIDSEGMSPDIQRELINISQSNFVVMAAGARPGDSAVCLYNRSFLEGFIC